MNFDVRKIVVSKQYISLIFVISFLMGSCFVFILISIF
ncbi:hypothetical protein S1001342_03206 (plasmid) [Acetobacter pasteurianus subsp. pasteurianus]|uniref:Lipoprotein n=1 Tax=Acetobacter pasteurianus subsp. pasteurianus TaxID=481145 RepID=A0A1Y0YBJ9_ACEPA|nr:hypothetical protein S1001342_03206 [Acetobacter pasteurianus subsp. pasteurianus]